MKSEFLGTEKIRVVVRQPIHRRRMSKSSMMNGDSNEDDCQASPVNMVAAIHDHISCTKSVEYLKLPESREDKIALACELDHMYANCSNEPRITKEETPQIRHLKELLLLHLDLLQQQHEQLTLKDRQIAVLRQERDALQQRLDRAERNVSAFRHRKLKSSVGNKSSAEEDERLLEPSAQAASSVNKDCSRLEERSLPGVAEASQTAVSEQQGQESPRVPLATKHYKCGRGRSRGSQSLTISPSPNASPSGRPTRGLTIASRALPRSSSVQHSSSSPQRRKDDLKKTDILNTQILYYTPVGESLPSPDCQQDSREVEVPSWRFHPLTSCYSMEGTENLDDDVFMKRHQKQEADEKRRKRWDIQRIREQRYHEHLMQGRALTDKQRQNQEQDRDSLFPDPDEVLYIEVSDSIPVCAFGAPIPNITPSEFSCPFIESNKRITRRSSVDEGTSSKRRKQDGRQAT